MGSYTGGGEDRVVETRRVDFGNRGVGKSQRSHDWIFSSSSSVRCNWGSDEGG